MINLIVGRPGGGKSYEAVVFHIIPAIQNGRKVVTNLPLNIDHFVKVFGEDARSLIRTIDTKLDDFGNMNRAFSKPEDYQDDWKNDKGQGVLVVVDEAHMVLPCSGTSKEVLEFLSLHRHYGIDIILITQSDRKLHRDVRDMVQLLYRCSKNTALGSNDSYTQKVKDGVRGEIVNTNIRRYKSSYFPFYQSHTASNAAVKEAMANDVKPLWQHWSFIGAALCLVFVVFMFATGAVKNPLAVSEPANKADQQVKSHPPGANENTAVPVTPAAPAKPKTKHPLSDYSLFVTGFAKQIAIRTDSRFDLDLSFDRVYLVAFQNNVRQFALDSGDLQRLGYTFRRLGDCIYSLEFEAFSSLVVCTSNDQYRPDETVPQLMPI
ncbi:zonular occludens toxin domain-containing protein [Photobacterium ganghwense]|uniref:zonular occludens toxin domain-containing protein n=3 Tax=Vibrionaceae TaxID=641 RepID=UPI001A8D39E8|nr:zonular occludens toxin domain-containing protein [Photobacterium ganghwense]QSV15466.1 assembly protein [Photobacterium ganghwense]QSV17341.1 assembly protein [Photobacterium ganghwense]